ncbi:hypothetical protein Skr01_48160 [Sphaerisporangium krabiense]|uniref:Uncharacterized protein n=1 Tax=Sphaerisporangium krabiense TaxID=763782 RepID=A0A7W9DP20_9ACTN|nr:hypothetical protein [Sphaerisporangium krabiense]MBB5625928.1 hypothetical protein [Sphaerisporangium krabiense]GII64731.1 hypothetical protein Skr01_48160 [Sphaerisporangium krabiense]
MDLTAVPLRAVAARPHVLPATPPGGTRVRLAAERELRLRDLPLALTPADADILLITGPCGPDLEPALERLWRDMPAPRFRTQVDDAGEVAGALEAARSHLADRTSATAPVSLSGGDLGQADDAGGHGDGETEMPAGLPMAEQGPDRDGLTLDRLHVALGPFLADWPGGLILRLTVQGDVVQRAVLVAPAPGHAPSAAPFWTEPWARAAAGEHVTVGEASRRRAAAHLDSMGRLLSVAGWPAAATTARRLRDELLHGAAPATAGPGVRRFARRVGRSRTLSWMTRGLGPLSASEAAAAGVGGPAARADGDVTARYRLWLATVLEDLDRLAEPGPLDPARDEGPRGPARGPRSPSAALAGVLPALLEGAEMAAARLIVASLDPDPDELAARPAEAAHG